MNKLKKASLSLSINAIVVLVLAITMLGLGLGFTKGMFGKFSEKLTVPEPDIPATADDPIVLPADTITVSKGKPAIFSVNLYNDGWVGDINPSIDCGTSGPVPDTPLAQEVTIGEDAGFKFVIPKEQTGTRGTHICLLKFTGEDSTSKSKQIVIEIR